jgi:hypothetical protein
MRTTPHRAEHLLMDYSVKTLLKGRPCATELRASLMFPAGHSYAGRKKINGPRPQPTMPAVRHVIVISSFDPRLSSARIAENKSLKNSGANTF